MDRTIGTALGSATGIFRGNLVRSSAAAGQRAVATSPRPRRRRKDDAIFIVIATLVAVLFVAQAGWLIAQQAHP